MNCPYCGTPLPEGVKNCPACDAPVEAPEQAQTPAESTPQNIPAPESKPETASRWCANCGAALNESSQFCPMCGLPAGEAAPAQEPGTRVCRNCGAEISPDNLFCVVCGARAEDEPEGLGFSPVPPAADPVPPGAPIGKGADAALPAGGVLVGAFLALNCLPYLLRSLLLFTLRGSIGAMASVICGVAGYAAAGFLLRTASKRETGKGRLGPTLLLLGTFAADRVFYIGLLGRFDTALPSDTAVWLIAALAVRLLAALFLAGALKRLFFPLAKGGFVAYLCALAALFAEEIFGFLWSLLPIVTPLSFISMFSWTALAALLESGLLVLAVRLSVGKPGKSTEGGQTLSFIAGAALAAAALVLNVNGYAAQPVLVNVGADVSAQVLEGELFLAAGDMASAAAAFERAGEHENAWRTLAGGGEYRVPDKYRDDTVLLYLSGLTGNVDRLRLDLARSLDYKEADLWLQLLSERAGKNPSKEEKAQLKELAQLCAGQEFFVFSYPTLKEVRRAGDDILELLDVGSENYEQDLRVAAIFGDAQKGIADTKTTVSRLLELAEDYPDDLSVQYAAAYVGSQNTWEGAEHYDKTAKAALRFLELWEETYAADASGETIEDIAYTVANMLVSVGYEGK